MLHATIFARFEGVHKDCVMDMVPMPNYKYIVTASMDRLDNICVWDAVSGKPKFVLEDGHKRGCKQLAWASDQGLLLSVGFEYEAYAWDVKTSRRPVMRLVGHRAPLMGIVAVKFNPLMRVVTADIKGNFKMWSIQRSSHSTAMVLQTWEPHDDHFSPLFIGANAGTREIVAGGYKLHRYCCRRKSAASPIPRAVLYNSANMTFAVALENEVQIFDSQTGILANHFHDVCDSEVTTLALDSRQRKLLVGTHKGEVLVFSYMTGALMKRFQQHASDVSGIAYCHGDKCIITTSWDRRVQICDEEPMGAGHELICPTLRSVTNAHATDIVCVAFDHDLSLFATASTDGVIRVYDFQFAIVEGPDIGGFNDGNIGHEAEITSLSFVGGRYPCLITADCTGILCMWAVRPSPNRGKLVHRWANLDYIWDDSPPPEDPEKASKEAKESTNPAVDEKTSSDTKKDSPKDTNDSVGHSNDSPSFFTSLPDDSTTANQDDIDKGEQGREEEEKDPFDGAVPIDSIVVAFAADPKRGPMLLTADEEGYIGRWDLRPLLELTEISPISMSKSPTTLPSYSAHRRGHRNADAGEDAKATSRLGNTILRGQVGQVNQMRSLRKHSLAQRGWSDYLTKMEIHKVGALSDGFPDHLQLAFAVPRVLRWKAHASSVNNMSFIDEEPYGVVTCSIDLSTRVWSLTGRQMGVLTMSDTDKEKILQGRLAKTPWSFTPDVESHVEHGTVSARGLIDAMARRKRRQEAKARRDRRREKTLLASKLALQKELAEEYGKGGGGAPENPLRAGLANLKSANITQEMRNQHDVMLERVTLVTRVQASLATKDDLNGPEAIGDEGAEEVTADVSTPMSAKELATAALLPAIPSYKNMEYEVAKVTNKQSAIMEIEVDTLPSPFLRKHLPKQWKRLTPGERLDKKMIQAREEARMMATRIAVKTSSPVPKRNQGMKGAASAPVLRDTHSPRHVSKHTASTAKVRTDRLTSVLSQIDSTSSASSSLRQSGHSTNSEKMMRERINAKLARFDMTIASVKATEKEAEAAERARKKLSTTKERPSLYQGYDDLFKDDETSERAERIRRKKEEQLKTMTHFGPYTTKEVLGLRKLFNEIDDDASGQIDVDEFVNATALQGSHIFMNAASMFGSIDRDESGSISFGELLAVSFPSASSENVKDMLRFVKSHESQEHMKTKISLSNTQMEEINNIFQLYDVDSSGGVSTEELYEAMIGSNPAMREIFSLEEMDKLVRQYDDDGNATLELEEFTKLFKDNFLEDKSAEAIAVGQRAARRSAGIHSGKK